MTSPNQRRITEVLFHPFLRVAGGTALGLGFAIILLTGWIGSWQGLHFDGVLDVHVAPGSGLPWWIFLVEGVIDWLCLALVLLLVGRFLTGSAFRTIDLIGTQALARWPMLPVSLFCLAPGFHRFSEALVKALQSMGGDPTKMKLPEAGMDAVVFALVTLAMMTCTVWMVALMWRSFSHCCNVRGGKAVAGFVVGLLVAEFFSKVLIGQLFHLA